jgi:hypothetical protein
MASHICKEDKMEEYIVNFLADVDIKIEAGSAEEAKKKGRRDVWRSL